MSTSTTTPATPAVPSIVRTRVTWSRWEPSRLKMVTSHPWVWILTTEDGCERTFDTKADAVALRGGDGPMTPTSPATPAVPPTVGYKLVCKRCRRDCDPWPLERGRRCSPSHWVMCIAPLEMCRVVEVGR